MEKEETKISEDVKKEGTIYLQEPFHSYIYIDKDDWYAQENYSYLERADLSKKIENGVLELEISISNVWSDRWGEYRTITYYLCGVKIFSEITCNIIEDEVLTDVSNIKKFQFSDGVVVYNIEDIEEYKPRETHSTYFPKGGDIEFANTFQHRGYMEIDTLKLYHPDFSLRHVRESAEVFTKKCLFINISKKYEINTEFPGKNRIKILSSVKDLGKLKSLNCRITSIKGISLHVSPIFDKLYGITIDPLGDRWREILGIC